MQSEDNISVKLQELLMPKYDINDRDFIKMIELIQAERLKAQRVEVEQSLYWLDEDSELEPEVIINGLRKDRRARLKHLKAELNKIGGEDE